MRGFRQDHRSNSPDRAALIRGNVAAGRLIKHGIGVLLAALSLMPGIAHAAVINVPADHAAIQAAIDAAVDTDEIMVAPGTYNEAIDFLGKAITLRSSGGAAVTTIDATGLNDSVVKCIGGEGPDTVLDGFTITGGIASVGGGMVIDGSSPTVTNCTFSGNTATVDGGGMSNFNSSPTVTNCTFSGNTGGNGGGMFNCFDSSPTVTNCTFSGNTGGNGGGMFNGFSTPTVTNCTFSGNTATGDGGGIYSFGGRPTVTNCTFSGNTATDGGGGMFNDSSSLKVTNCTFSGNTSDRGGGMFNDNSTPIVTNCILWGDSPDEIFNSSSRPRIAFSDVEGSGGSAAWDTALGTDGGRNIDVDPLIVPQLLPGSPCLDAGDNTAVPSGITTDLAGNPRFVDDPAADTGNGTPPIVDMGAYEGPFNCDFSGGDLYVATCGRPSAPGAVPTCGPGGPKLGIQEAITAAAANDVIIVAPGTYMETIDFLGKEITLRSACGPDVTTIDATGLVGNVVTCTTNAGLNPVLDGFTLTGGTGDTSLLTVPAGGGMLVFRSTPTVNDCIFIGNSADFGGGLINFEGAPTVIGCTFADNEAINGGGMYDEANSSPTVVTNCLFQDNTAKFGGGMYANVGSVVVVSETRFLNNTASFGGGARSLNSTLDLINCDFEGNTSHGDGGGLNATSSSGSATNCRFFNNVAEGDPVASGGAPPFGGGAVGLFASTFTLTNCTLVGNEMNGTDPTDGGGGVFVFTNSTLTADNSIFWNNTAFSALPTEDAQIHLNGAGAATVTFSDIQDDDPGAGTIPFGGVANNNIDNDPSLVDAVGGDLRLQAGSPAIDAGSNAAVPADTADLDDDADVAEPTPLDLAGTDRFSDDPNSADTGLGPAPIVDMGAYENFGPVHNITQDTYAQSIQTAINNASGGGAVAGAGDEIVVAPGTYNEAINFLGKAITLRSSEGAAVTTIDATGLNDSVVKCIRGEGPDTVLDGFTIIGGNALGGGGMLNSAASPTVTHCTFSGNTTDFGGGGMYNFVSSPTVTNCTFNGNLATTGGGMFNFDSNPTVTNCTFSGNTATEGGGMYNELISSPTVTNCILWGDSPDEIFNFSFSVPTIAFSDVEGSGGSGGGWETALGTDGGGNIDADPLLVDAGSGDLRLTVASPCVEVGDNAAVPAGVTTDLDGNPRFFDADVDSVATVDMGAYELQQLVAPDPLEDADDGLGGDYNRVGDFKMPTSAVAGGQEVAIRVKLNRMYIDSDEDASQCPVRQGLPDLQVFEGQVLYLGPPEVFSNNDTKADKWVGAKLQCTPLVRDWSAGTLQADLGNRCSNDLSVTCTANNQCGDDDDICVPLDADTIYYYGAEVVPCSIHAVQQGTQSCIEFASEDCFSDPLEIRTALWGDVWEPFGGISFTDIGKIVDAFKSIPFVPGDPPEGAPIKVRAMLRENSAPFDSDINFTDIGNDVDAFKSIAYAEDGPTPCP